MKRYATELIVAATGENDLVYSNGDTQDIITVLLDADKKAAVFTKQFAKTLKGSTLFDTCRNIWEFVKTEIPYKIDPLGYQDIRSPGRLFSDQKGDCKSFSLFVGSCLTNLGIPYGYRFVSFRKEDPTATHVYVYVPLKAGGEIIIDPVWKGAFNTQKSFAHKKDYLMAKISYLGAATAPTTAKRKFAKSGTAKRGSFKNHPIYKRSDGTPHVPGVLNLHKPYHDLTDEEMTLCLARQRMEIEKQNAVSIGSPFATRYDEAIGAIEAALMNVDNPDAIIGMADDMIGKAKAAGKKNKAGGLLKKIGTGLKKAAKVVAKVVTAPARLVVKGALEIYLPKAAPMFLYLFTPEGMKLPDLMARKKAKSEKLKKFIVNGIGMKEPHFMAIIRNNLTKRFGKSPESYLQERLVKRVSGIAGTRNKAAKQQYLAGIGKIQLFKKKAATKSAGPTAPTKISLPTVANKLTTLVKPIDVNPTSDAEQKKGFFQKLATPNTGTKLTDVVKKAGQGDLIGGALAAVSWLIEKVSSIFKKEKVEAFSADDIPDIERDASNVFEWQDMTQDYSNLNDNQKKDVKVVTTDLLEKIKDMPLVEKGLEIVAEKVKEKLPFLDQKQAEEIAYEVGEGAEPITEEEGIQLGNQVKQSVPNNNIDLKTGGGGRNFCQC